MRRFRNRRPQGDRRPRCRREPRLQHYPAPAALYSENQRLREFPVPRAGKTFPGATAKARRLLCLQFYLRRWRGSADRIFCRRVHAPSHGQAAGIHSPRQVCQFGFLCGKLDFGAQNALETPPLPAQNSAQKKLPDFHLGHPIARRHSFLLTTMLDAARKRI